MEPTIFDTNIMWQDDLPTGWSALYQQLIERVTAIDPTLRVTGVKQQGGRCARAHCRAIIQIACQMCSAPGELRADLTGVYATLCDVHAGATRPSDRPVTYTIVVHPSDD